ncbi:MAG: hypothetical protein QOH96_4330 [Blastocatellia bacterium]|nr:hypothetical protein [Blastocatellia bacterium]
MKPLKSQSLFVLKFFIYSCILAAAIVPSALAQGKQDFTLHNATGVEIDKVYVSPHKSDDWEEDVLGRDTLADGESVEITFGAREKPAHWDLKIMDKEGTGIVWEDLNLLEISELTLHYKDGKAWADVK